MAVKTTIGQPARENEYFDRPALTGRIWEKIQAGSNLLMSAPRRVGKSSIMFHFLDNPPVNSRIIYIDTEAVNNENEFFKKLFHQVINTLSTVNRYSKMMANFTRELGTRIESIGIEGISIGNRRLNYYDEFLKLLKPLDVKNDRLVIMLVSEFDTITSNQVHDMAVQYNLELNFRHILNALKYDGYINNNDEPKVYRFNSPLLKTWWFKNVAF